MRPQFRPEPPLNNQPPAKKTKKGKTIIEINRQERYEREWPSIIKAEKKLNEIYGVKIKGYQILDCLKGRSKTAGGREWRYKHEQANS